MIPIKMESQGWCYMQKDKKIEIGDSWFTYFESKEEALYYFRDSDTYKTKVDWKGAGYYTCYRDTQYDGPYILYENLDIVSLASHIEEKRAEIVRIEEEIKELEAIQNS